MQKIYSIASVIYRFLLLLVIPFSLYEILLVASAGHDPNVGVADYLILSFIILIISLLTIYRRKDKEYLTGNKILRYFLIALVSISILFESFLFYWSIGDYIAILVVFIFLLVTTIVLAGLIKNKL